MPNYQEAREHLRQAIRILAPELTNPVTLEAAKLEREVLEDGGDERAVCTALVSLLGDGLKYGSWPGVDYRVGIPGEDE